MQVLYIGKILGIYAYKSGRHQWLKSSDTREKISYISTQLYFYDDNHPSAMGYRRATPKRLLLTHLEMPHIHYVFPKTNALNITEPQPHCAWLPQKVWEMVQEMNRPAYIQGVEEALAWLRAQKKGQLDSSDGEL
jgi:hypothetical protein